MAVRAGKAVEWYHRLMKDTGMPAATPTLSGRADSATSSRQQDSSDDLVPLEQDQAVGFAVVRFGGYDKRQVDDYADRVEVALTEFDQRHASDLEQLNAMRAELQQLQQRLSEAERRASGEPEAASVLTGRLAQMLALAEQEAAAIRASAADEADRVATAAKQQAARESSEVMADLQRRERELAKATEAASSLTVQAQRDAETVRAQAKRDTDNQLAAARREAEAVRNAARHDAEKSVAQAQQQAQALHEQARQEVAAATAEARQQVEQLSRQRDAISAQLQQLRDAVSAAVAPLEPARVEGPPASAGGRAVPPAPAGSSATG